MREVNLLETLSPKESQVYRLVCQGWTNKEIAEELTVSSYTVKFHLTGIMRKLGVRNRSGAVAYGQRWQHIEPSQTTRQGWTEEQIREAANRLSGLGMGERKQVNRVVNDLLAALQGKI